ncbi:MAG TPA: hypothetical protein VF117_10415 [Gammaproteobacteria bacterium]
MRRMKFGILIIAALLPAISALAAETAKPVDVRDLMSVTRFHDAGLDKLTPKELATFNAWFNSYLHQTNRPATVDVPAAVLPSAAAAKPAAAAFGSEQIPDQGPQQIESRIDGVLRGWTGNTVFKLENGQVWQQAGPGYETDMRLDHPQVVIKKLAFGYLLTIPGNSNNVFVRRIK